MNHPSDLILLAFTSLLSLTLAAFMYRCSWKLADFRTLKLGRLLLLALLLGLFGLDLGLGWLSQIHPPLKALVFQLFWLEAGLYLLITLVLSFFIILEILLLMLKRSPDRSSLTNFLLPLLYFAFLLLSLLVAWQTGFRFSQLDAPSLLALLFPALASYFSWEFLAFYLSSIAYAKRVTRPTAKYFVVHGAGLVNGSEVGPLLASRIKAAVAYATEENLIVFSGGKGSDEYLSEAAAMQKYATEQLGFPKARTLLEDRSTSSYENLVNSAALIKQGFLIFTSDFHVFRCLLFAKSLNLDAQAGPSGKTIWSYRLSAFLREFIALLNFQKTKQVLWVAGIIACLTFLALLSLLF